MTTASFADRRIALKNRIGNLKRFRAPSRSELELAEGFANSLGSLRHDVNQFLKAHIEIGTEVDIRFTTVVDCLGRVKAYMGTELGNAQPSNIYICSQKAEKNKASRLLHFN